LFLPANHLALMKLNLTQQKQAFTGKHSLVNLETYSTITIILRPLYRGQPALAGNIS